MLDDGLAADCRKATLLLPALVGFSIAFAGCGRSGTDLSDDQDSRNKGPAVTCELRCEWTPEGPIANLSFKNVTDGDVKVLERSLLAGDEASELTWSPFEVAHRGVRVPYAGKMVKRAAPTDADYRTLAPGEVVTATTNIKNAYNFTEPGAITFAMPA